MEEAVSKNALLYGAVGLTAGVLITVFVAANAVNNSRTGMMNMMGMNTDRIQQNMMGKMMHGGGMTMNDMVSSLQGKTGDAFDQAFIEAMIEHHQGAIDMAELAKQNAKHNEIKQMADDIISAQTREIDQMRQWARDWGY